MKTSDALAGNALRYYTQRLRPKESLQLVLDPERAEEKSGIKVVPLAQWLDALPFD